MEYRFLFNNEVVEYAEQYKRKVIEEIHRKALGVLNRGDPEVALILTYIVSIIMCNACIWEHTESKTLASIQLNALRFTLEVGKACPTAGLSGESG